MARTRRVRSGSLTTPLKSPMTSGARGARPDTADNGIHGRRARRGRGSRGRGRGFRAESLFPQRRHDGWHDASVHFLENGGAVAVGGVIAALIAVWGVSRTIAEQREATRAQQWWTSFVWIFEQATGARGRRTLVGRTALDAIERLFNEARTELEIALALGLEELVQDRRRGTTPGSRDAAEEPTEAQDQARGVEIPLYTDRDVERARQLQARMQAEYDRRVKKRSGRWTMFTRRIYGLPRG